MERGNEKNARLDLIESRSIAFEGERQHESLRRSNASAVSVNIEALLLQSSIRQVSSQATSMTDSLQEVPHGNKKIFPLRLTGSQRILVTQPAMLLFLIKTSTRLKPIRMINICTSREKQIAVLPVLQTTTISVFLSDCLVSKSKRNSLQVSLSKSTSKGAPFASSGVITQIASRGPFCGCTFRTRLQYIQYKQIQIIIKENYSGDILFLHGNDEIDDDEID